MATTHTVKQGEHLSGIAQQYGFRSYRTIWDHPENAGLKANRKLPHVLMPGDQLSVPDKEQKTESRATGAGHRFQVPGLPLKLRIVLLDFDNQPIANADCELTVEGETFKMQSGGDGLIQADIPRTAQTGTLRIPLLELEYSIKIGHLDPIDEDSGWQARLINLGYHADPSGDTDQEQLRYAIEEFQCDHQLSVTGALDAETRAKLNELHGT